uniref:Secreted protein n=1 Tax=Panagrellus redivivus TaxID=6233 RepID=A0A7E4ULR6_PANRE
MPNYLAVLAFIALWPILTVGLNQEEGQYPIDIELYICDEDLCNTQCDASAVGLGIALILGAGLIAYFTKT